MHRIARCRSFGPNLTASVAAILTLSSASCDFQVLSTRAGKHVTYHWNADERWLCGGTVAHADLFVETMAGYYGMSLDGATGPTVEYFWGVADLEALACFERSGACVRATPTTRNRWRSSIFTDAYLPIHGHELAHAVVGFRDHGLPFFVNEGLAGRWQSSVFGENTIISTPLTLDEAQVRAELDRWAPLESHGDYDAAFAWFAALELTFGPAKMAEFMRSLTALSSSDKVDEALRRTMGISLAESVELAANYPSVTYDDPVCDMKGVPIIQWVGAPIVIDRQDAGCADEDVVNWYPGRVISIFILEFPDDLDAVNVTVSGTQDALFLGFLKLKQCYGGGASQNHEHFKFFEANAPTREEPLRGRWVASIGGDIDDDGTVFLPRVEFTPVQP